MAPMTDTVRKDITIPADVDGALVVGGQDANLRLIESYFNARIVVRDNRISLTGSDAETQTLTTLFTDIIRLVQSGEIPTQQYILHAIELTRTAEFSPKTLRDDVLYTHHGKSIRPKTAGQKRYADAIRTHTVTFGVGPAGTGKTFLAVAMALAALRDKQVGRIILTRPIVEAGENLGFLPGTLTEKVDPYIRPLYDAIFDMVDAERAKHLFETGEIEIAPLAFMRGRTLSDSFIILDEAQNATPAQMKMFLTRLGFGSKMVVTGDPTQFDIPRGTSGLAGTRAILQDIDDIAFCDFTGSDVVRHSLVAQIVAAYDRQARKDQE